MDGILNINKPAGATSTKIVTLIKRLTGERRVGHAGTLDPFATGVLPICLGKGTRIVEFLVDATKTYRGEIEFGITTDTYDATGAVTERRDPSGLARQQVESALSSFQGTIWQTPPMYSALRHHGARLYKLARAGLTIERKSRLATIHDIRLLDWQTPVATVEVVCGKGTYIRSLAYDLGRALGCGAYLKALVRRQSGPFCIEDAVSIDEFKDAASKGCWQELVYPVDFVLSGLPAIVVDESQGKAIMSGQSVALASDDSRLTHPQKFATTPSFRDYCRAYTTDGRFLAVLHFDAEKRLWQPDRVFLQE
ncbi:MAG: tRNA pseudouridine(55) synthase TruB [Chloroflexi bacterium]|nr:tRNA pseudouridine(55) synthase TruB [Chloroflexota bacterium]